MDELVRKIRDTGISVQSVMADDVASISSEKGAYLLLIRLRRPVNIRLRSDVVGQIGAGWLVYSGSAKGPGGLHSRLQHHFQKTKKPHWHVDHLTTQAVDIAAIPVIGGDECQLIDTLLRHPAFSVAISNFGSTDCKVCESHLLCFRC